MVAVGSGGHLQKYSLNDCFNTIYMLDNQLECSKGVFLRRQRFFLRVYLTIESLVHYAFCIYLVNGGSRDDIMVFFTGTPTRDIHIAN